jgi:hypothetical protein
MRTQSGYYEKMQRLVQEYRDAGEPWPATKRTIAVWMINNKKWARTRDSMIEICSRDIGRALREEYHTDPQNRRVRTKVAARFVNKFSDGSREQMTLWGDARDDPREFVERGVSQRRKQIVGECFQLSTDVDSYNENRWPDKPIQLLLDFTDDVAERKQSGEFNFEKTVVPDSSETMQPFSQFQRDVLPTDSPPLPSRLSGRRVYPARQRLDS